MEHQSLISNSNLPVVSMRDAADAQSYTRPVM